ncbi:MAG TPA: peptidoglycan DD-metalloendopeptidase family protein [Prolixibacteraceae bacterium]|nr:peptidoglycan DD-metalloendopeptidase family protein [Prolixibacteraceae bacterium]HQL18980.1 peptidoglycan DD-metalloendopeptidase family protein [Prolixibacteraceae bacterium]
MNKKVIIPGIIGLGLLAIVTLFLVKKPGFPNSGVAETADLHLPVMRFGLPVDSFNIIEGIVKPGQNLGEILTGFGVPMSKVDQLSRNSEEIFDVRKIRSGQKFFLFQSPDTVRKACYLVYENNLVEYVIFGLSNSMSISRGEKKVQRMQKSASGIIASNLWNTMTDNDLNPMLAIELSKIYAWTIDFFGIQKGDKFRLLYEEQFVDTVSTGVGPVYAVEFEHMGKNYYAFRFSQDEGFDYFDDKGENLRKAFLKAPLEFSRISSRFSGSRLHPVLKIRRPHHGVDYAAPLGTPVVSIGDGTVIGKGYQGGSGNFVKIRHNAVYTTMYLHLSRFGKGVSTGSRVQQGEVIGYVGSTGLSTGPHLDFRVFMNGTPIDPLKIDAPPGDPVKTDYKQDFIHTRDSLTVCLYSINWHR